MVGNNSPSKINRILLFATQAIFPITGQKGIWYCDISTGTMYTWNGSSYDAATTGGSGSFTTYTDPALNAITQSDVDTYIGAVITLTTTGNDQTLPAPTDTSSYHTFTVINNDTSTDPINIIGASTVALSPAEKVEFIWDGTAWIASDASGIWIDDGSDVKLVNSTRNLSVDDIIERTTDAGVTVEGVEFENGAGLFESIGDLFGITVNPDNSSGDGKIVCVKDSVGNRSVITFRDGATDLFSVGSQGDNEFSVVDHILGDHVFGVDQTGKTKLRYGTNVDEIVTSISGSSTDDQLATAKAIWDAVAASDTWDEVMHNGNTFTVLDTENLSATINQNDTTNNPAALVITNTGSGNDITLPGTTFIINGQFGSDTAEFVGATSIELNSGGVLQVNADSDITLNHDQAAINTIIKGQTDANLFFVDGTNERVGFGTNSPNTLVDIDGGLSRNVTTVNAATYDLLITDDILNVTYTVTGAVTSLTLPTAQTTAGRTIVIKDAGGNAATNNITIDTEGGENIDGSATYVINIDYDSASLYSDGSNWFIY
jgi:hypothetical protein